MKIHPIIRALGNAFPDADFDIVEAHDWNSMTFSGQQIAVCCNPKSAVLYGYHDRLSAILPEHEFNMPGLLVADIVVRPSVCLPLMIDVLVISE